jgi:hypothetical protein
MGINTTPEGIQARKGMETRHSQSKNAIQELIVKICNESVIYLAGGNKVITNTLKESIQEALYSIADRQFPEFKGKADFIGWPQALAKALAGNPDALSSINYAGDIDKHPVSVEIIRFLSNLSKTGKEIQLYFDKSPYGWSQDSINTMLVLLKTLQYISSAEPILKVVNIPQISFKKELITLTVRNKMDLRKIFEDAGLPSPPNQDLNTLSDNYLSILTNLAFSAMGESPRPALVIPTLLKDIEKKTGNERLLEILRQKDDLQELFSSWKKNTKLVNEREPNWELLLDLLKHDNDPSELEFLKDEAAAIKDNRLLLEETDLVEPLLTQIAEELLKLQNLRKGKYISLYDKEMLELQGNDHFKKLTPQQKNDILKKYQLLEDVKIEQLKATTLLIQLNQVSLFSWDTKIAALPGQFQSALEDAVLLSAPQAKTFSLPRKTISSQDDINVYIDELKTKLEALFDGSGSIILK